MGRPRCALEPRGAVGTPSFSLSPLYCAEPPCRRFHVAHRPLSYSIVAVRARESEKARPPVSAAGRTVTASSSCSSPLSSASLATARLECPASLTEYQLVAPACRCSSSPCRSTPACPGSARRRSRHELHLPPAAAQHGLRGSTRLSRLAALLNRPGEPVTSSFAVAITGHLVPRSGRRTLCSPALLPRHRLHALVRLLERLPKLLLSDGFAPPRHPR